MTQRKGDRCKIEAEMQRFNPSVITLGAHMKEGKRWEKRVSLKSGMDSSVFIILSLLS
jgi:hypothetical protein